jgi:hypothetical protein
MSRHQPYVSTIDELCKRFDRLMYTNPKPIPLVELNGRYITRVNAFLLDAHDLKKRVQYMIDTKDPELLSPQNEIIKQFKLLIDIADLWANPKLLQFVEVLKNERQTELKLEKDMEKQEQERRDRFLQNYASYQYQPQNNFNAHDNMTNIHLPQQNINQYLNNPPDDDIASDISEDDFMAENVTKLIDDGYNNINKDSILRQTYNIEIRNHCVLTNKD